MKKMYKELFLFKWALLLLILTVIGSVAANLALPMYLSEVINTAIPAGDKVRIVSIGGNHAAVCTAGSPVQRGNRLFCVPGIGWIWKKCAEPDIPKGAVLFPDGI